MLIKPFCSGIDSNNRQAIAHVEIIQPGKAKFPLFSGFYFKTGSTQMNFQKTNNIAGWAVFTIALITYWLTMEETASYWDCGEFIAVSYKLEVPHPPGAPFFLLIGRLFSFLAFGDVTKVAYWINFSSVLASAFSVLFDYSARKKNS
jgi:hypothetical protein